MAASRSKDTSAYASIRQLLILLHIGLPLVTVADARFASRVAAAILIAAACPHTLARSHDDYVALVVRLELKKKKIF